MAKCDVMTLESLLPFSTEIEDGTIFVDDVDGNGKVTGRHRKKGASPGQDENLKNGKCKENEKKFECEREGFKYDGRVFSFLDDEILVVIGTRSLKQNAERKKDDDEEVDGDEVWVGVKTGGV